MTIQQIMQKLTGMNLLTPGQTFSDISSISPSSIEESLEGTYGGLLEESMFQGISPFMTQRAYGKTYSPLMQSQSGTLIGDLSAQLGGQQGKQAAGGFAGSGQLGRFTQQAKDVYGKGMTDVVGQRTTGVQQGLQSIYDLITSWETAAQELGD